MKKKQFFRNFMTIMLFGAVGTLISFSIISVGKFNGLMITVLYMFHLIVGCTKDGHCMHCHELLDIAVEGGWVMKPIVFKLLVKI